MLTQNFTPGRTGYTYGNSDGSIGILKLTDSAGITVNGTLCAFGLISGNGIITVNSGATVYEFMEVRDMRSIFIVKEIYDHRESNDGSHIFPFSNFFVKNIEASVTYLSGASLKALYSVMLQGNTSASTGEVPLIGSQNSMFNLSSGSLTKWYNRNMDQTIYRVNESSEVHTGTFSLSMSYSAAGQSIEVTLDTADYYLPLCAGYGIEVAGKMTFNNRFKLLPGASLNITKDGEMTVADGAEFVVYRLNDYDLRKSGSGTNCQGYSTGGYPVNSSAFPTSSYNRRAADEIGSVNVNVDGTLTVLGGLYVTNDLRTDLDSSYKENGYNVLTGTGKVDMSTATTTTGQIFEAQTAANTNTPVFDPVTITPIAGLKLGLV